MKFALMIVDNEHATATPAEMEKLLAAHGAFSQELIANKAMVYANRLRPSKDAVTLRQTDGERVFHDGPFMETKEIMGGFYVIDCASKEDAIKWAKKIPLLPSDAVEVRPIWEM